MRAVVLLIISLCGAWPIWGQGGEVDSTTTFSEGVLWRGFSHRWTYNHRINRLGDYVHMEDGAAQSVHTSASGFGQDSTYFESHYSLVKSPNVYFQEGFVELKLFGKEKQLLTKTIEVTIPASEALKNRHKYVTVLNGFDLNAIDRADKLHLLRMQVGEVHYAPEVDELRFQIQVALVVDCQSFECARFNQKTTYKMRLHYMIMAADEDNLSTSTTSFMQSYPWGRRNEFSPTSVRKIMRGSRTEYKYATIGFKSLALSLNAEHWMLQYNANITPLVYNSGQGVLDFALDLYFKEWQHGMKRHSAKPKHSKFSSKRKGWCLLDAGIVLLQFKDAKIVHQKRQGTLFWEGKNISSEDMRAVSSETVYWPSKK